MRPAPGPLVLWLLATTVGAQTTTARLVNEFAVIDTAQGGVHVVGYPTQAAGPGAAWTENGTRVFVWKEEILTETGARWWYVEHTPSGADWTQWGFVPVTSAQLTGPVQPSAVSVRGAGVAREITDVLQDPPLLAVGSRDGYLNLRAGPSTDDRVLIRIPNDAHVSLVGCATRAPGAPGRWCLASYEAEVPCDEGPYCPGPVYDGYVYTAALFTSCDLQDAPSDPAHPCYGRVGRLGPKYESAR